MKFFLFIFLVTSFAQLEAAIERRAAIDVGSGGTKVAIADVDSETNEIIAMIFDTIFPVAYQASLDKSLDGTFDQETKALGIQVFKEIKQIADHYQVEKIAAIATSAFRKANNAKEFVTQIHKVTKIKVAIIPQREEGELAYYSALSSKECDPEDVVVLDIGTGSLQITTANKLEGLTVYMGEHMGAVSFKNYIIEIIQEGSLETRSPNPMSEEDFKAADRYARSFARKAYPIIKEKIQEKGNVVGIGRLFFYSIRPHGSQDGVITRSGLRVFIEESLNKSDQEFDTPFAYLDVSNCILTLAIMKALHIEEIHPLETTSTKGILVSPFYWNA